MLNIYVTNFNVFDSYYWKAMFEDFVFPDGSKPNWDAVNWLQKRYMKWLNEERTHTLLTFPVMTVCLLTDENDVLDKEYKDFVTTQWAEGDSFFVYLSRNADSISSCCYSKDTKVLIKDANGAYLRSFEEISKMKFASNGYRIFNNGKWSKGKLIKLPNRPTYKVTLSNNKSMILTDNHRNNVFQGPKLTTELTTDDYLMVNSTPCDTYAEVDEHLTYEQGFAVGAFLGDGSFGCDVVLSNGDIHIYETNYSLSENKIWMKDILNKAASQCGSNNEFREGQSINNVIPLRLSSKEFVAFIIRWTNWTRGMHASDKEVNMDCVLQSIDFRKGIIDGWYATDGNFNSLKSGESLRGYSTSKKLIECIDTICTSLGYITSINVDERTEGPIFRGIEYTKNHPVYCLLKYAENKHQRAQKDICIFRNNSYYFKIKSIEPYEYKDEVYCFEMDDETDDLFTLANGIHNFNCRLRNYISDNTFSSTTGLTGVQTGSCNVITLNLNRITQDFVNSTGRPQVDVDGIIWSDFKSYLESILDRVYDYQKAYKTGLYKMDAQGMFPQTKAGYISFDKLYCTIGVNGLNEAARFLGMEVSNNEKYMNFASWILGVIKDYNKLHSEKKFMFNLELVPAESLGVKNYNWDKADGYWVPEDKNLYNSYIYDAHDNTSILDKISMQGGQIAKSIDGGQASHLNLSDNLDKDQYTKLLEYAVKVGNSYITFNIPQTQCDDCGFIAKHPFNVCPKCGSDHNTQWTRIIGYLRPIKVWSKDRQIEQSQRYYASHGVSD